jgi:uncharacterized membrane protein YfcA
VENSLILLVSVVAGFFTSLVGLGGGMLLVPLLTLLLGFDIKIVAPASLFCVVATSLGACGHYLRRREAQLPIAAFLEPWALVGALLGAYSSALVSSNALQFIFALFLFFSAWSMLRPSPKERAIQGEIPSVSLFLNLKYEFSGPLGKQTKYVFNPLAGGAALVLSGVLSALLGIGGGVIKVLVMNRIMDVPLRTAIATSNLMIGLTASAGAAVYLLRGNIHLNLALSMSLGVLIGSWAGGKIAHKIRTEWLKILFILTLILAAIEMGRKALF